MPSVNSSIQICNKALSLIGCNLINDLNENTNEARACRNSYDYIREKELSSVRWTFSIKRAVLPKDTFPTLHGNLSSFEKPADCLRLIIEEGEDWRIEGTKIITEKTDPLNIRYISNIENVLLFPPIFIEVLSTSIALEICQKLTGSMELKQSLEGKRFRALAEAKRINSIESETFNFNRRGTWNIKA